MRCSLTLAAMAIAISEVSAFPSLAMENMDKLSKKSETKEKRVIGIAPGFDAKAQYVSNTGTHKFVAPDFANGDLRGPCPGLNAMANHGYLPHNGWASIEQFIEGTGTVFGMGADLAAFLAVYGTVTSGNPISTNPGWSIGGPGGGQNLLGNIGGLLGTPQGISGSHNKYETDSSPTRGDLYQYGNDYKLQMPQFQHLYGLQKNAANPNYNLDVMLQHREWMFEQSVANNPYFFYGPFTGVLVSQAAFTFVYRFMSNKSAEAPEGILNKEVLKSFFSVSGPDNALVHTPGHEKIPNNWYKRAIGDEYTINFFQLDILSFAAKYPRILDVGGNVGTKNSFAGVDIGALTNGVYNSASLLKGNNLACFLYQNAQLGAPDAIKGLYTDATKALSVLTDAIAPILKQFSCPTLTKIDETQFSKFPGASKSYSGYTPVIKREESFTA